MDKLYGILVGLPYTQGTFTERKGHTCTCHNHIGLRFVHTHNADQVDIEYGGYFQGNNPDKPAPPKYVYCNVCNKRHSLYRFGRIYS